MALLKSIPRKIPPEKVNGVVIIRTMGSLPYETDDEAAQLEIWGKIYLSALERGAIIHQSGILPQIKVEIAKIHEHKALNVLGNHMLKNMELFHSLKEVYFLSNIAKRSGDDILIMKRKKIEKYLGRKLA